MPKTDEKVEMPEGGTSPASQKEGSDKKPEIPSAPPATPTKTPPFQSSTPPAVKEKSWVPTAIWVAKLVFLAVLAWATYRFLVPLFIINFGAPEPGWVKMTLGTIVVLLAGYEYWGFFYKPSWRKFFSTLMMLAFIAGILATGAFLTAGIINIYRMKGVSFVLWVAVSIGGILIGILRHKINKRYKEKHKEIS